MKRIIRLVVLIGFTAVCGLTEVWAQICARVVIQIEQELTLEREGFEARLGINNTQPAPLENFSVVLKFSDVNGNPVAVSTDAAPNANGVFYYRPQSGSSSSTTIASNASGKYAYLIVPAPGAAGNSAEGKIYYVGATVKYTLNGVEQTVEVAPDFIRVRPMPSLQLQYFLPGDVYGDDPMTTTVVEPVVPFPLGVRVMNHSPFAPATKLKIQSGQPEIIDNQLGLLIDFRIIGCQVNGLPAEPSLLVNFGDIKPQRSAIGSWLMIASLSGKFVKFTAEVSHAADLGGELTSLIPSDAISTHRLLGKVLVDLPGRDTIPDFLATDVMVGDFSVVKLYESGSDEISQIVDYLAPGSSGVSIAQEGANYRLTADVVSDKLFVQTASPISQDKQVRAVRSDGKVLPAENAWVSKTKDQNLQWKYSINLFDTNKQAGQTYLLTLSDPPKSNRPPVLTIWGGRSIQVRPGAAVAVQVSAVDPDGMIPMLSSGELPDGASFVDNKTGVGRLTWTPQATQLGSYLIQFRASDGVDTDSKSMRIAVVNTITTGYGEWQKRYWPDGADGAISGLAADPDHDGIVNLIEYALGGDPTNPDETILPEVNVVTENGNQYLALTFLKRIDDPTLAYEVVGSDDVVAPLNSWQLQSTLVEISQEGVPQDMQRIRIRDSVSTATTLHRYLRLRVTRADTP